MAPETLDQVDVEIVRVGSDGDGVAVLPDGKPLYLPFTLPGERVRASSLAPRGEGRAGIAEILDPSPDRVSPPCPHFGTCGGCALQHWGDEPYLDWKSSLLSGALRRAGFTDVAVPVPTRTPPHARRRIDLAIRRDGASITLGLHAHRGLDIVDMQECTVLHPALFAVVAPLRKLLRSLTAVRREGSALLNLLDSGPDLLLRTDAELDTGDRTRLAAFAASHGLPRIGWARGAATPETACLLRPPTTDLAGLSVRPPPGGFLQASREGEAALRDAIIAGLPPRMTGKSRIAELYAGSGSFTAALARHARVDAFEGDPAAAAALTAAVNNASLAGRIEVRHRDLQRQPLSARELSTYAAVVLDPPYGGALTQMAEITASKIPRVIYVSCNPVALARDASLLHAAGYRLLSATPVDQFLWSARLESVAVFSNARR